MNRTARFINKADKAVSIILGIIVLFVILYNGYALWDTYAVLKQAELPEAILRLKPDASDSSNLSLNELAKLNRDVCAWITVDNTNIDYPVVKGETNLSYINTDIYGKFSVSGSIFLDYRSNADFSDYYSLIYGHHMDAGAMFGDIKKFSDKSFFDSHSTGTLKIFGNTYSIEFFAYVSTDAYNQIAFTPNIVKEADKAALNNFIAENAVQYRDIILNSTDRIVGLSTCSDASTNGRIILFGKLVSNNVTGIR